MRTLLGFLSLIGVMMGPGGCSSQGASAPPAPLAEMPTGLSQKIDGAGAALVPDIRDTAPSSLTLPFQTAALTYGTTGQWDPYTEADSLLTDIFGSAENGTAVVTRIRVVLYQFGLIVDDILDADSDFTCEESEFGTIPFSGGDTVEIAFFGDIENGTEGDRHFDCVREDSGSDEDETWTLATLYGLSSDGTVRIAYMQDVLIEGTERNLLVVSATYQEEVAGDATTAFLDIQYNQRNSYADNSLFKSRTRITGQVVFDDSNAVTEALGDFAVTRAGVDSERDYSKHLGRGGYGAGDDFLFRIQTENMDVIEDSTGFFCLEAADPDQGGIPLYIDGTNCAGLETSFAWGEVEFFTDLLPPLTQVFEDGEFFDEDDLISDDGSNFTIPNY